MSQLTAELVKDSLRRIVDRDSGRDVVSAGMISGVVVHGSKVGFVITIDPKDKDSKAYLRDACESEVATLPGVESVTAVMTAQNDEPIPPRPESGYAQPRARAVWNLTPVEGVSNIIVIASGKGGVGKSTTAVNLAMALQKQGRRVGLLDADIYGPSIPRMMALTGQPEIAGGKMIPLENHGIQCMSMGFITGDQAAVLRGPMISKSLHQLLRSSRWGAQDASLDVLLVDMPPGTGDIHLSMAQQAPLSGAVIVTTPQEVALTDARKCLQMFQKVNVPILGVIENMSGSVFGSGGGRKLAEEANVPFLGVIEMDAAICAASDAGSAYSGKSATDYKAIAEKLFSV